jgi:hypothetical protein
MRLARPCSLALAGTMGGVEPAASITWRSAAWYALAYVSLAAVICVAAVLLLPLTMDLGDDWFYDPQDNTQRLAAWRGAAVSGVTSGSEVGFLCALVAGMLASRIKQWRTGLVTAIGAGAGLALVNVTVAWFVAAPRLHERWENMTIENARAFIDPDLWDHRPVLAAIALVFLALMLAASIGFGVALVKPRALKLTLLVVTLTVSAVIAPIAHLVLPLAIVP